jgi:hypothetical protein
MKEGIRSAVTMRPLASPIAAPTPMPTSTPKAGEPVTWMTVPARHAVRPTLAPIDRSRPAVSTTSVSPAATKNIRLAWRSTLRMLFSDRKESVSSDSSTQISSAASRRYDSCSTSPEICNPPKRPGMILVVSVMSGSAIRRRTRPGSPVHRRSTLAPRTGWPAG